MYNATAYKVKESGVKVFITRPWQIYGKVRLKDCEPWRDCDPKNWPL